MEVEGPATWLGLSLTPIAQRLENDYSLAQADACCVRGRMARPQVGRTLILRRIYALAYGRRTLVRRERPRCGAFQGLFGDTLNSSASNQGFLSGLQPIGRELFLVA